MYQHPDDFSEYREYTGASETADYVRPDYYQPSSRSAQPVQSFEPYVASPEYASASSINAYNPELMSEYRGPSGINGYTVDAGAEQRAASERGRAEGGKKRGGLAGLGAIAVGIGTWLLKFKSLAFLLKFGGAGITALISIAFYSLVFGWRFAVGLVALLFIHEMGHAVVMKLKGIPVGAMIFIPMMGAAVMMRQMPQNARDEAEVGIAGPIAGTIASSFCLFMATLPGASLVWAALAYFGFFINLFNLVPIVPFDGGRVLAAIDRRVWWLGFAALLGFFIWTWINGNFSIFLLLFVLMAGSQFWSRRGTANVPGAQAYYDVPIVTRITLSLLYFGLIAVLVLAMSTAHAMLPVGQ